MIERTATRGQFVGTPFWGCRKYQKCTGIAPGFPGRKADAAAPGRAHGSAAAAPRRLREGMLRARVPG